MSPISEEELRSRLREVAPSPAQPGFADHLVRQGRSRRRRQRWVGGVAAAAAAAIIGGGAFAVSDQLRRETALPATPTPSPTQPEVTPTATRSGSPSATVTTTASPTGTSTSTTGPSSTPRSSSTPSDTAQLSPVTFLHQEVKDDGDPTNDWVSTSHVIGPCDSDASALAAKAAERRAIRIGGWEGIPSFESLFVFADHEAAVAFMGKLRELTRACQSATEGQLKGLEQPLPGPWGEGLAFTYFGNEPEGTISGGPVGVAVRVGRAVTMASSAGPFSQADEVDPGIITSSLPAVEHVYPQLCRYTEAGC